MIRMVPCFSQIILAASMLLMAACSPEIDTRGHVGTELATEEIKPERTTRDEVLDLLGSPSSTSDFGDETWYYIQAKKQRRAFLAPKTIEQNVVRIEFDRDGVVKKLENYGLKDGKRVDAVSRITPTEGHELGFVEQVLGNVGRFNKNKSAGAGALKRDRSGR